MYYYLFNNKIVSISIIIIIIISVYYVSNFYSVKKNTQDLDIKKKIISMKKNLQNSINSEIAKLII